MKLFRNKDQILLFVNQMERLLNALISVQTIISVFLDIQMLSKELLTVLKSMVLVSGGFLKISH